MHDLAIVNGTVATSGRAAVQDVAIEGDIISEVATAGTIGPARKTIDATDLHVLPGAVDVHFHCRAPSHPERGTFSSETRAAASGGVTTILEMPISNPPCTTPEVLQDRAALGERESHVDFGLFAGAAVDDAGAAEALAHAGAAGFKLFTHNPPPGRESEFDGLWATGEDEIYRALEAISVTGLACTVHAESESLIRFFEGRVKRTEGPEQPAVIEATAVALVGAISQDVQARVHIAHLSSAQAVDALRGAKAAGAALTGETCPHYLVFTEEDVSRFGPFLKVAPPIRSDEDSKTLWESVRVGDVEVIASDHAPFTYEEKDVEFHAAPRGIPGVEMMVPIVLDAVLRGVLPLETAVASLCENPARIFGLFPRKGTIRPGSDADIALWDTRKPTTYSVDSLFSKARRCAVAYDGMKLRGRLDRVLLRGRVVHDNGSMVPGAEAKFLRPLEGN